MIKLLKLKKICYALLMFLILFPSCPFCGEQKTVIAVQPFGKLEKRIVEKVKAGILTVYRVEVIVLPYKNLPGSAYYKARRRYRAEILLDYLDENTDKSFTRVLGLTGNDISTIKGKIYDWGIFGLGSIGGRPCVVSTFRLRRGRVSRAHFYRRLIKVVNHELGHTFGLGHCPNKGCLMQDAKGTIKTVDGESGDFCPVCRKRLKGLVR